jgi:signal transduction histidine kinase/DNA-binding response OmpR family regulator
MFLDSNAAMMSLLILFFLIIIGSTVCFFLLREKRMRNIAGELLKQVEDRTTQLEQITKDERKARLEAEQSNIAKSVFLATMSHEIRTPMNGVVGMASLLKQTSLTLEQKEYTDTIITSGESLLNVINDILDFSKIEAGKMELEQKDFTLRNVIEEVLDLFASKANKTGIDLIYQIDFKVPATIIGDSLRLRQVITNLVSNAIKFTQQGEIFIGVHLLNVDGNKASLGFEVRDTGIGIPADKISRLFKSFSQVDSSTTRKYGGTGLGLVICEKLIALMQGSISVESEAGKGTRFSFNIIVDLSHEAQNEANLDIATLQNRKILIVGDNFTSNAVIQSNLKQFKCLTTLVTSGKEALLLLLETLDFDLIIADMQMSDMDGMQLASRIRQEHAKLPIILLGGLGDDKPKGRLENFCAIVNKPIKQNVFIKQILRLLKHEDGPMLVEKTKDLLSTEFSKIYPLSILIAEDNLTNQKLAERVLTKLGYKPEKALNGEEALFAQEKRSYDLILMDMQMPVMDGLEATGKIRRLPGKQPIILATTANAMSEDRKTCLDAGMDDYISKPLKVEELVKIIEKWALKIKENPVMSNS